MEVIFTAKTVSHTHALGGDDIVDAQDHDCCLCCGLNGLLNDSKITFSSFDILSDEEVRQDNSLIAHCPYPLLRARALGPPPPRVDLFSYAPAGCGAPYSACGTAHPLGGA